LANAAAAVFGVAVQPVQAMVIAQQQGTQHQGATVAVPDLLNRA
jgi:hypothetical protein